MKAARKPASESRPLGDEATPFGMGEEEKVFKDPVHGYIYVHDPIVWDLINTREMQRLRRIRQLGMAYLTYPGAEHSRFSHALGVYEVVRQILLAFERNGYDWPHEFDLLVKVAGLLHDVGHPPLSHALEEFFGQRHEAWTERIILDPATEVNAILRRVDPGFPEAVAAVIGKRHPSPLVVSLVSGQLDADRLDYLVRDSLFAGVDYGKFDLARILRVILPYRGRIVVKRTGLHTVEAYLLARYFMYWQVYFHPVCRAAEVALHKVLLRARDLARDGRSPAPGHPALERFLAGAVELGEYLALDDTVLFNAVNLWRNGNDAVLADLAARLLDRRLFKYCEYQASDPRTYGRIEGLLAEAGWDPRYYCEVDETGEVYYDYYLGEEAANGQDGALFLWDERTDRLIEMSRLSRPINAVAREPLGERRLYVPEEVLADPRLGPRLEELARSGPRRMG